jgi:uncharacterized membrane protein
MNLMEDIDKFTEWLLKANTLLMVVLSIVSIFTGIYWASRLGL